MGYTSEYAQKELQKASGGSGKIASKKFDKANAEQMKKKKKKQEDNLRDNKAQGTPNDPNY